MNERPAAALPSAKIRQVETPAADSAPTIPAHSAQRASGRSTQRCIIRVLPEGALHASLGSTDHGTRPARRVRAGAGDQGGNRGPELRAEAGALEGGDL